MQDALARSAPKTGFATTGTRAMCEVPRTANDLGFGKIFGSRDAFRGIRKILTGSKHGKALLGWLFQPRKLRDLLVSVMATCLF
jgi:hypothetical protein